MAGANMECEVSGNEVTGSGEPAAVCEPAVAAAWRRRPQFLAFQAFKAKGKGAQGSACAPRRTFCVVAMRQFYPAFRELVK